MPWHHPPIKAPTVLVRSQPKQQMERNKIIIPCHGIAVLRHAASSVFWFHSPLADNHSCLPVFRWRTLYDPCLLVCGWAPCATFVHLLSLFLVSFLLFSSSFLIHFCFPLCFFVVRFFSRCTNKFGALIGNI